MSSSDLDGLIRKLKDLKIEKETVDSYYTTWKQPNTSEEVKALLEKELRGKLLETKFLTSEVKEEFMEVCQDITSHLKKMIQIFFKPADADKTVDADESVDHTNNADKTVDADKSVDHTNDADKTVDHGDEFQVVQQKIRVKTIFTPGSFEISGSDHFKELSREAVRKLKQSNSDRIDLPKFFYDYKTMAAYLAARQMRGVRQELFNNHLLRVEAYDELRKSEEKDESLLVICSRTHADKMSDQQIELAIQVLKYHRRMLECELSCDEKTIFEPGCFEIRNRVHFDELTEWAVHRFRDVKKDRYHLSLPPDFNDYTTMAEYLAAGTIHGLRDLFDEHLVYIEQNQHRYNKMDSEQIELAMQALNYHRLYRNS
jgi:hypothetical protein